MSKNMLQKYKLILNHHKLNLYYRYVLHYFVRITCLTCNTKWPYNKILFDLF